EDRRTIYRLSRPGAAKPHCSRDHGEAAGAAASLAAHREGSTANAGAKQAAGRGKRDQTAAEARQLHSAIVLLRLAAAFRRYQRATENVHPFTRQGETELIFYLASWAGALRRLQGMRPSEPE